MIDKTTDETNETEDVPAIGTLRQGDSSISDRALVLALDFLCHQEESAPARAASPGELLEVAALIEGYLTGAYRVEFRPTVPSHEGGFALFGQLRAVMTENAAPITPCELTRQIKLRRQAEAMLEDKAWEGKRLKLRIRRMIFLNWFLASFTLASGLLELWLCGWL